MARLFLHLRDGADELLDQEGVELAGLEAVREKVLSSARHIMAADLLGGVVDLRYRIDAENEGGQIVYTLPFKHAFNIIPEPAVP